MNSICEIVQQDLTTNYLKIAVLTQLCEFLQITK